MDIDNRTGILGRAVTLAACTASLFLLGCATARIAGGWSGTSVIADGGGDEWAGQPVASVGKGGMHLSVASDSQRVYVLAKYRANDEEWARPTAFSGLTLKVVSRGKKTVTYRLPDGPVPQVPASGSEGDSTQAPAGFGHASPQRRAEDVGMLRVTDAHGLESVVPADGSRGPAAGFRSEFGLCTYEFSVPMADASGTSYGVSARPGEPVSITVTAGLSEAERAAFRNQAGSMHPGGSGEMPSGGPGGQGGPGSGGGFGGNGGPPAGGTRPGGGSGPGRAADTQENPAVSASVKLAAGPGS